MAIGEHPPRTMEGLLAENAELRARVASLEATVEKLLAKIAELEARLDQNSSNSSKPPSSDGPTVKLPPKKAPTGRKPGGQRGHKGAYRALLPVEKVDEVVEQWPHKCEGCKATLPTHLRAEVGEAIRHQVTEIPRVKAHVTEYRLRAQYCECGCTTRAELPAGVGASSFGVRLQAVLTLFTGCYHVSRRATVGALSELFGVELSLGSVSACERGMSEALAQPVEEAHAHVMEQKVIHADETGWRERRARAWLWVAATSFVTVFMIHQKRGRVAAKVLLGHFAGILVTDRWGAYADWCLDRRQLCWAHLKRDFTFISEHKGATGHIGEKLLAIEKRVFELWHRVRDGTLQRSSLRKYLSPLKGDMDTLLSQGRACDESKVAGMCRELMAVQSAFWTFARLEGVEPTNNHAERSIRPAVLWRKGSYGTHSESGSRYAERMMSVVCSLKQQQRGVLDFLIDAGHAAHGNAITPSLLPRAAA